VVRLNSTLEPKPNVYLEQCPSRELLARMADKWATMVVVALDGKPYRFGELKRLLQGVSQKMLTQTLRNLERDGFVTRTVSLEKPLRVTYQASPLGKELASVLEPLISWAEESLKEVIERREQYDASFSHEIEGRLSNKPIQGTAQTLLVSSR
jgi:DNA-binding HxlR family transcriptional regulator